MKIRLAGIFFVIFAALGTISISLAESPGTGVSKSPAVSQSVSGGAVSPGPPVKKKIPRAFRDLPITPAGSDREDCFNDEIPYTPIPQG